MSLTITQLRLLALSKRRFVTDVVAWFMLYLMLALVLPLLLWHQYDIYNESGYENTINAFVPYVLDYEHKYVKSSEAAIEPMAEIPASSLIDFFNLLIKDMIWFGLWLIPVVYFNLLVLKKYILDYKPPRTWKYTLYLFGLLAVSAAFAAMMYFSDKHLLSWTRTRLAFPPIMIINFGVALMSTGLIYRKELIDHLSKKGGIESRLEKELEKAKEELKKVELAFTKDYLKVGTKKSYDIIRYEEILYFEGAGNEPFIWTMRGRFHGNNRMMDYEDQLPSGEFIRIHRKYIIAKKKVIGRRDNEFILDNGKEGKIQLRIGDSYLNKIDADEYLGDL